MPDPVTNNTLSSNTYWETIETGIQNALDNTAAILGGSASPSEKYRQFQEETQNLTLFKEFAKLVSKASEPNR